MKSKIMMALLKMGLLKLDYIDKAPAEKESLPIGPLRQAGEGHQGSLLIFAPRNTMSAVIDDMTGGYGYSHLAIDCGEIDIPTGKRVMIESTPGLGVHNSFQDEYSERKFVRIPLEKAGINVDEFCDCIRSKLGEKYDDEEVLTLGLIDDPAKQVCSDLAMVCLPEATRADIARYHQAGLLHSLSVVHAYKSPNETFRAFVSPNGFAEYFGAPRGKQLNGPDQLSEPTLPAKRIPRRIRMLGTINQDDFSLPALLVSLLGAVVLLTVLNFFRRRGAFR